MPVQIIEEFFGQNKDRRTVVPSASVERTT